MLSSNLKIKDEVKQMKISSIVMLAASFLLIVVGIVLFANKKDLKEKIKRENTVLSIYKVMQ